MQSEETGDSQSSHLQHYLDILVDLSSDEYARFIHSQEELDNFVRDAQLFMVVVWNYQEYHGLLSTYLDSFIRRDASIFDQKPMYLNINRAALNFLSSVRTYLDYTETTLSRRYGGTSAIFRNFKVACSRAYDDHFSYRFLYKLRNYAQHCGFPIDSISLNTGPADGEPSKVQYHLQAGAIRDTLLENFSWEKLTDEIAAQPPLVEINQHMDVMMKCLDEINHSVTRDIFAMLHDSAAHISELVQRVPQQDGELNVFELEVVEDEAGKVKEITNYTLHGVPERVARAVLKESLHDLVRRVVI